MYVSHIEDEAQSPMNLQQEQQYRLLIKNSCLDHQGKMEGEVVDIFIGQILTLDSAVSKALICIEVFYAFYEDVSSERKLKTKLLYGCVPVGKLPPACILL